MCTDRSIKLRASSLSPKHIVRCNVDGSKHKSPVENRVDDCEGDADDEYPFERDENQSCQ